MVKTEGATTTAENASICSYCQQDVARNITMPEEFWPQMEAMPFQKTLKQAGRMITPEILNRQLNEIPRV